MTKRTRLALLAGSVLALSAAAAPGSAAVSRDYCEERCYSQFRSCMDVIGDYDTCIGFYDRCAARCTPVR